MNIFKVLVSSTEVLLTDALGGVRIIDAESHMLAFATKRYLPCRVTIFLDTLKSSLKDQMSFAKKSYLLQKVRGMDKFIGATGTNNLILLIIYLTYDRFHALKW